MHLDPPVVALDAPDGPGLAAGGVDLVPAEAVPLVGLAADHRARLVEAEAALIVDDLQRRHVRRQVADHPPLMITGGQGGGCQLRGGLRLVEALDLLVGGRGFPHGQGQGAQLGSQGHGCRLGRGPHQRPVRGRHGQPDPMTGGEHLRDPVERDPHAVLLPRLQGLRVLAAAPVGEVEDAVGHPCRLPIGQDVREPDDEHRHRFVRGDDERALPPAADRDIPVEEIGVEGQGAAVLLPLVEGQIGRRRIGGPFAGEHPHAQRRFQRLLPRVRAHRGEVVRFQQLGPIMTGL